MPDTSNPMKVVIFAEADRNSISFIDGLPYNDPTTAKFPTQALNFTEDNPVIGGRAVEYLVVVGSGEGQIKNAFNRVSSAKDRNGNPFVQDGTELIVMGHASPGTAKSGMQDSGGVYGGVTPAGWKTIIQDTGLYDKFKTVNYGSCQMGEELACVNLSYAFGTDTKVIAQTDFRWGQGSSPAAMYGDDWSKTKLYKDPALEGGTVADALHSVGAGQVEITGYDRKQIRSNVGKAPFKLDKNQQFEDIGFGQMVTNVEEHDAYLVAQTRLMEESPTFAEQRANIPQVGEKPENVIRDPWTGDMTTETQNRARTKKRAMNYMQKQFWDEEYGEYDESGNLIGHTRALPDTMEDDYGTDLYQFNDEDEAKFEAWEDVKDRQTRILAKLANVRNATGGEVRFVTTYNADGKPSVKVELDQDVIDPFVPGQFTEEILAGTGWTLDENTNTIDLTGIELQYELDTEGSPNELFMGTFNHGYVQDNPSEYQYINNYRDWITQTKFSGQMNQLRTLQSGSAWDTYREQESLQERYMDEFGDEVESYMETELNVTKPTPTWEGGMLLDSDDMIPTTAEFLQTPGLETDMLVSSMHGNDDLQLDKRVDAIWSQYEERNPQALEAFNVASETLEGLGVEPNTPYWDKLIGLEALRLYALSDE
mgnify:CR=1 FL=1